MNLIDFLRFFLREAKKKLRCKIRNISIQMQIWIEILRILQRSLSGSLFLFFTKFWIFLRSGSTFSAHYSAQKSDCFSKSLSKALQTANIDHSSWENNFLKL